MEERVDTVETGDRVLIRVVSCTAAELPDPPDSELRPLSLLLWAWWLLWLMFPPASRRDGLAAAEMCFKILDDEDELSEEALDPGDEKELEGVDPLDPPPLTLLF